MKTEIIAGGASLAPKRWSLLAEAIEALNKLGIGVKILTGDNELVTVKVCREVGLNVEGLLLGSQIDELSDHDLLKFAESTTVFAKLTPSHKERIVEVLHNKGHVVGFMGDGINDAPALRAADIGISVDTAVDIAKEAADDAHRLAASLDGFNAPITTRPSWCGTM